MKSYPVIVLNLKLSKVLNEFFIEFSDEENVAINYFIFSEGNCIEQI